MDRIYQLWSRRLDGYSIGTITAKINVYLCLSSSGREHFYKVVPDGKNQLVQILWVNGVLQRCWRPGIHAELRSIARGIV